MRNYFTHSEHRKSVVIYNCSDSKVIGILAKTNEIRQLDRLAQYVLYKINLITQREIMEAHKQYLVFIVCAFAASVGNAATVQVKFDNPIFNGSGYDIVTVSKTDPSVVNASVASGRFQGTASNLVGVDNKIFVDNINDLFLYCYDIYQHIGNGSIVDYTIKLDGESARTLDFLGAVNTVMSGSSKYDPYAWLHPINRFQGAAIQIGIWESLYETNPAWDLGAGTFRVDGLEADTTTWWNSFKGAIGGSDSLDGKYVMVLESNLYQDMLVGDPPTVPEPGSLALLGLGLAGLVVARRNKTRVATLTSNNRNSSLKGTHFQQA